jgi:hypothetical protein
MKKFMLRIYLIIMNLTIISSFVFVARINRVVEEIPYDLTMIIALSIMLTGTIIGVVLSLTLHDLARSQDEVQKMEWRAKEKLRQAMNLSKQLKKLQLKKMVS